MIHKDSVGPSPYSTYILPVSLTEKLTLPSTANPFTALSYMGPPPSHRQFHHAQRVQGHNPQGLCQSQSLPYIDPAINEGVDPDTHCQPLHSPITAIWAVISFATQTSTCPNPRALYD